MDIIYFAKYVEQQINIGICEVDRVVDTALGLPNLPKDDKEQSDSQRGNGLQPIDGGSVSYPVRLPRLPRRVFSHIDNEAATPEGRLFMMKAKIATPSGRRLRTPMTRFYYEDLI